MSYNVDVLTRATLGLSPGIRRIQLRGYNAAVSNATETVWTPGSTYAQLTSAVVFEAVSSSANDAAAGTGARTIEVITLDGNYEEVTQTVTLNGTNAVDLTGTHLAVNRSRILTAGSGTINAGDILIRVDAGGATKSQISTGAIAQGISADFVYTIPADHVGLIRRVDWSLTGATGSASVTLLEFDTAGMRRAIGADSEGICNTSILQGRGFMDFGAGYLVPEKTQLELRCLMSAGAGVMTAMGELFVIPESILGSL